jgi:hypothetical protein
MKALARAVSALALVGIIAPPLLYLTGRAELGSMHGWMLAATVAWFASTPLWMLEQKD